MPRLKYINVYHFMCITTNYLTLLLIKLSVIYNNIVDNRMTEKYVVISVNNMPYDPIISYSNIACINLRRIRTFI